MTAFQKQVLQFEEKRQQEESQNDNIGDSNPSGTLNAKHPSVGSNNQTERIRYRNEGSSEAENQAEFVDT